MPTRTCRVCHHEFFKEPLLRYKNIPKAAQYFPDAEALKHEKGVNLEICQCSSCGLVQLNNAPVAYYREVIRAVAFSEEMRAFRLRQFKNFIAKYSLKDKKVIEIGCGRGEYLFLMQQCGAKAYGIEYSPASVKQCQKENLKVSKGFIETNNMKLKNSPFNAFFILNFLEHLPKINLTLQGIAHNLTDEGIGLIEVPNFDMILKKRIFSEFIGDHLFYFTKETLKATLGQNGFDVLECENIWHDYIISAVVRKRSRLDLSEFYNDEARLKETLIKYIRRFKKVAVWGAGHQALFLIAATDLAGKIAYVIDSAPFKQGKYTPATHIPIVSPERLNEDPVDAVIVMAAGYSNEVAKIIRQKFDSRINIAILRNNGLKVF